MDDKKAAGFQLTPLKAFFILILLGLIWAWSDAPSRFAADRGIPFTPRENLKGGVPFGRENSPFRDRIFITRIEGARRDEPAKEYISIKAASGNKIPTIISGLRLSSGRNPEKLIAIPQGVTLPYAGIISSVETISLQPNEEAIIISGRSPIGASFKVNKCSGYLGNLQLFNPLLPASCPSAIETLSRTGSAVATGKCAGYAQNLPLCTTVSEVPATIESSCRARLLSVLNYNGCVNAHRYDNDFFLPEWRVYLGEEKELWNNEKEIVKILDRNNEIIDAVKYLKWN